MFAVDTSSLIEYFNGSSGRDVDAIQEAFEEKSVRLPRATYLEILSDPKLPDEDTMLKVDFLSIHFQHGI